MKDYSERNKMKTQHDKTFSTSAMRLGGILKLQTPILKKNYLK